MNASLREIPSDSTGAVDWHPGKLWSLWDIMQTFDSSGMFSVVRVAVSWTRLNNDPELIGEAARGNIQALSLTTIR